MLHYLLTQCCVVSVMHHIEILRNILIFVNLFRLHSYYNGSSISESYKRYIQSQQVFTFMIMKQNVIYTRAMLFSCDYQSSWSHISKTLFLKKTTRKLGPQSVQPEFCACSFCLPLRCTRVTCFLLKISKCGWTFVSSAQHSGLPVPVTLWCCPLLCIEHQRLEELYIMTPAYTKPELIFTTVEECVLGYNAASLVKQFLTFSRIVVQRARGPRRIWLLGPWRWINYMLWEVVSW